MRTVPLRYLADVDPPTPELVRGPADELVTFMPLETVWPDARVDTTRRRPRSEVTSGYTRFRDGDILCPKVTPTFQAGRSALVTATGCGAATTEVFAVRAKHGVDPRYVRYALLSRPFLDEGVSRFQGVAGLQRVPEDFVRDFRVRAVVSIEQRRIADFLDDQVTRLDAAATCARAVAAGAENRFRGILSDAIDGTQASAPVKALVERITSGPRGWGDLSADDGSVFLRIANLPHHGTTIIERDVQRVAAPLGAERERTRTRPGDVLVSITASLGDVGLVRDDWTSDANVSQHVALLRPRNDCSPEWLAWALQTPRSRDALTLSGYGGAKIGLGLAEIADHRLPDMPLHEQVATAAMLNEAHASTQAVVAEAGLLAGLLAERKGALITACSTGDFYVSSASDG